MIAVAVSINIASALIVIACVVVGARADRARPVPARPNLDRKREARNGWYK